ncbi:hypothetical protein BMF94_0104 [Rhodotorula taiwanensis]|uniref:Uncharacterized protein n=1 Tax=Rhodotorula taiwanensis TaxID=741276 RepID=A0A2S5BJA9_9BASI|nr:hypothetical protein BMF94_0104 [Rhodotorula taiwanensis]
MFVDAPTASLAAPALRPLQLARSPSPFALAEVSPPTFTSDAGMKRQRSPQGGVADPDLARSARIDGSQLVLGQTEAQEVPFVLSDASDGTASQPPAQVNASEGSKFGSPNCSTANEFLPDLPEARLDPAYDLAFGPPEWEIDTEAAVSSSSIVGAHLVGFDDSLFSSRAGETPSFDQSGGICTEGYWKKHVAADFSETSPALLSPPSSPPSLSLDVYRARALPRSHHRVKSDPSRCRTTERRYSAAAEHLARLFETAAPQAPDRLTKVQRPASQRRHSSAALLAQDELIKASGRAARLECDRPKLTTAAVASTLSRYFSHGPSRSSTSSSDAIVSSAPTMSWDDSAIASSPEEYSAPTFPTPPWSAFTLLPSIPSITSISLLPRSGNFPQRQGEQPASADTASPYPADSPAGLVEP